MNLNVRRCKKKNNYIMDIGMCLIVFIVGMIINKYELCFIDFLKIKTVDISFLMGVWQVQVTISLISLTLVSIIVNRLDFNVFGEELSDILSIRNKLALTYWDKVLVIFILFFCNLFFVYIESMLSVLFILTINMVLVFLLFKGTFEILFRNKRIMDKVKLYIFEELESCCEESLNIRKNNNKKFNNGISKIVDQKIRNGELIHDEWSFIISLLLNKKINNNIYVKNAFSNLINSLIENKKYEEFLTNLKEFFKKNKENKENVMAISKMIVDCFDKYLIEIENYTEEIIDMIMYVYKEILVYDINVKNNDSNETSDKLVNIIILINKKLVIQRNFYLIRNLINSINKILLEIKQIKGEFVNMFVLQKIIKDFSNLYINNIDLKDVCEINYFEGYNTFIAYTKFIIDDISTCIEKQDINYKSMNNYLEVISNIKYYPIKKAYQNKEIDKTDKSLITENILDDIIIYITNRENMKNSYKDNEKSDCFSKLLNGIMLPKMINLFYENEDYHYINKYVRQFIKNIPIQGSKIILYEVALSYIKFVYSIFTDKDKEKKKKNINGNILYYFIILFNDSEFKKYVIENIFYKYEFEPKFTFMLLCICVDDNKDRLKFENYYDVYKVINFTQNDIEEVIESSKKDIIEVIKNAQHGTEEMVESAENDIDELLKSFKVNIGKNYNDIINILNNEHKILFFEQINRNYENEKYNNIKERAKKIYKNLISKKLKQYNNKYDGNIKNDTIIEEIKQNIDIYIPFENDYYLEEHNTMHYMDSFSVCKENDNMVTIGNNIIKCLVNEIKKKATVKNLNDSKEIIENIKKNSGIITIFNKNPIKYIYEKLPKVSNNLNEKILDLKEFLDYSGCFMDEELKNLGSLIIDEKSFQMNIICEGLEIYNTNSEDINKLVNTRFQSKQDATELKLISYSINLTKEEFRDLVEKTVFRLQLTLSIKINIKEKGCYYVE